MDKPTPLLAIHIDFNCEALTRETVSTLLRFAASLGELRPESGERHACCDWAWNM